MSPIALRGYQEHALVQVMEYAVAHPRGRVLLVMPPRAGKTPTAAAAVEAVGRAGARVLWIVHRIELLEQAVKHLVWAGVPREEIGLLAADRPATPEAWCQVATEGMLTWFRRPKADFLVWDEAQHDAAPRRRRLRELYPDAFHLGITGTPERLGGGGLERDYDRMIVAVQSSELIHDEHLAVPTIFAPQEKMVPNMKHVRSAHGDFVPAMLERLMNQEEMVESLVNEWRRLSEGRRTIVFPVSRAHSRAIVEKFGRRGIAAAHLDGETAPGERRQMLVESWRSSRPWASSARASISLRSNASSSRGRRGAWPSTCSRARAA